MSNETQPELEIVVKGNPYVRREIKQAQPKVKPSKPDVIETDDFGKLITAKLAMEILEANNTALIYKAAKDGRIQWANAYGINYYSQDDVIAWAEDRKQEALIHPRKPRSPNKPKTLVSENGSGDHADVTVTA